MGDGAGGDWFSVKAQGPLRLLGHEAATRTLRENKDAWKGRRDSKSRMMRK